MHATAVTTIRKSRQEVYDYWRDFSRLPTFMYHLESVTPAGDGTTHWIAKAPLGQTVEWDAEIVDDVAGERIAWRAVEGATVPNRGAVFFTAAPADQGTEVRIEIEYSLPGGVIGQAVARVFGEEPKQQMHDDLRRFKQLLETGEIVVSNGSPDGLRTQRQFHQEDAQP